MLSCVNNMIYCVQRSAMQEGYGTILPLCSKRSRRREPRRPINFNWFEKSYDLWFSLRENCSWNKSLCRPCLRVKFDPYRSYHAIRKSLTLSQLMNICKKTTGTSQRITCRKWDQYVKTFHKVYNNQVYSSLFRKFIIIEYDSPLLAGSYSYSRRAVV